MKSESRSKTALILFSLALIPCLLIGHHEIMSRSIDEAALQIQAQNFTQAIAESEVQLATYQDFDEFIDTCTVEVKHPFYGEAQQPGEIGYQPIMDDTGIVGFRVTAMGNSRIVFTASYGF